MRCPHEEGGDGGRGSRGGFSPFSRTCWCNSRIRTAAKLQLCHTRRTIMMHRLDIIYKNVGTTHQGQRSCFDAGGIRQGFFPPLSSPTMAQQMLWTAQYRNNHLFFIVEEKTTILCGVDGANARLANNGFFNADSPRRVLGALLMLTSMGSSS